MGEGYRGIQKYIVVSLSHCLLLFWQSWKVEAANVQLWEREDDALFHDRTIVGSVVLAAGGISISSCARFSLVNGYDLFAYSKSLQTCHAVTANNIVYIQTMHSMQLYKKQGTLVANNTFDGVYLRTPTSTYQVVQTGVSRDIARTRCTAAGSQLVVIDTLEKQSLLRELLNTYSSDFTSFDFWIEGSQDSLGTWTFPDGSLMPMDQGTFWHVGTPNDIAQECVRMRRTTYLWDDYKCNANYGYICETP